jgi:hypothetical protein
MKIAFFRGAAEDLIEAANTMRCGSAGWEATLLLKSNE